MLKIINTYKLNIIFLIVLSTVVNVVTAQMVTVTAEMDTTEFLIGDQVGLELKVTQPYNVFVGIPIFDEELTKGIEILDQSENDTTLLENGDWLIKKRLLITAFDSGYYVIPPIPVLYYSDTIKSEPFIFKINSVKVDTSEAIKDIKMPYTAPISFAEIFPWAGGGLGLAILILVIIYILRKIKRKEPILGRIKPREPAHIIALRDLSRLMNDKLWQKDRVKDYYTVLTDILRMYLWNRFSVRTLERTSEEILESLKVNKFKDEEAYNTLKEILYTSDLVKFAKFKPVGDEHEKCLSGSYSFVDRTKLIIEEKPTHPEGEEEEAEAEADSSEKYNKGKVKVLEKQND
ncbi:MAG: hypothetical protein KOO66_13735 [Bacteroidales bacterium]|nr:hypothetical protein [Bacteroidales bacterium]